MTLRRGTILSLIMGAALVAALILGLVSVNAQDSDDETDCDYYELWRGRGGMMGRGGTMGHGGMMGGSIPDECFESGLFGMGMMGGMMGHMGMGSMMGMMGDFDQFGQFGPGSGMMGAWTPPESLQPSGSDLTLDQATAVAEAYIAEWDAEQALELGEMMQFSNHFYAQAVETETGRGAFEFLIDSQTGVVVGEPGPNMMWNLRYGANMMMGAGLWQPPAVEDRDMPVTAEQAQEYAQAYLDEVLPGTEADDEADAFYGYYTLHILQDGEVIGMLSVNGYSGQVWLHHWHGEFVEMTGHDAG